MPKVSVILTSYNHEKYIEQAIDSVLAQSFSDFELIIWDDCSTDRSWHLINQYTDARIIKIKNETQKRGVWGINHGIRDIASGDYIAIHHSDDIWERDKLLRQVSFLDNHGEIGAVFTDALAVSEDSSPLGDDNHPYNSVFSQPNKTRHEWLRQFFISGNSLCHPSVLIRKVCFERCGYYRYGLGQLGDFDMWVRLCMHYEIHVLPEKLVQFRVRDNEANTSGNRRDSRIRQRYDFYKVVSNFRSISTYQDLLAIFPDAHRFLKGDDTDKDFALAMTALEVRPFPFTELFGLDLMFELISDPDRYAKLQEVYEFSHIDFIALTGDHDPFAVEESAEQAQLLTVLGDRLERSDEAQAEMRRELNCLAGEIQTRSDEMKRLTKQLEERDHLIAAIQSSRSWKATAPFRQLLKAIHKLTRQ